MKKIKSIRNTNLSFAKRAVILRVDFNCPIKQGQVLDDFRIEQAIKTVVFLINAGVEKIVMISHLGRPKGSYNLNYTLRPVIANFSEKLTKMGLERMPIEMIDYSLELNSSIKEILSLEKGIVFLENIRFWSEEEKGDEEFAKKLANLGSVFINDAFGVSHRDHASVSKLAKFLPAYAGILLEDEIQNVRQAVKNPQRPAIAIVGGAKLETKIPVLKTLVKKYDKILIGGLSAVELRQNKRLFNEISKGYQDKLVLAKGFVGKGDLDIDKKTIKEFEEIIKSAKTILWNGPMGKFEEKPYHKGSKGVAKAIAKADAFTITGGGETNDMLKEFGTFDDMSFISTGGGAMLELISGNKMPGIEGLN
jgi:phosphoglycerate kinase